MCHQCWIEPHRGDFFLHALCWFCGLNILMAVGQCSGNSFSEWIYEWLTWTHVTFPTGFCGSHKDFHEGERDRIPFHYFVIFTVCSELATVPMMSLDAQGFRSEDKQAEVNTAYMVYLGRLRSNQRATVMSRGCKNGAGQMPMDVYSISLSLSPSTFAPLLILKHTHRKRRTAS